MAVLQFTAQLPSGRNRIPTEGLAATTRALPHRLLCVWVWVWVCSCMFGAFGQTGAEGYANFN